ncbi:MAG: UTP--glucose-1-phosphate uridylyltransferase GalU [Deltaproteobacteria bacterium]|nr:UTP--glucose-1-phosphate uridylyltransferase GalU [Deltaproteobacteria bacterium]MCL5879489.1 UTP--glucose-1-phosphate uridylyltransferase GalU [Deltaproteobacteria bacterium]MDA8304526.1 UTP--glucose-1-phosphate uridylyltransferase GalU [Deltaproteobacteria bacterium]
MMKVNKAIFPAAGLGTRLLPITKSIPKEMLVLVDKPLIQYGVEECISAKINDIIIVTGRGKTAIEDYFDRSIEHEIMLKEKGKHDLLKSVDEISNLINLTYTRQKEALGLGHAILCAQNMVGEEPFAVVLSDDIIDSNIPVMKQMIDVYKHYRYSILAVQRVRDEDVSKYGIIQGKEIEKGLFKVEDLVEKPEIDEAPSNLAIIGRYILMPQIFDFISKTKPGKGGEIQLTDAIKSLLSIQPVYALEFEGIRYDGGNKLDLLKAQIVYGLKNAEIRNGLIDFIKKLDFV